MHWNVAYYQKENGDIPVLEFMQSLEVKLRAKTVSHIQLLEQCGPNLKEPYVKAIKGAKYKGLWELRVKFASNIARVLYFTVEHNTFIMLHGFQKKTNKTPPQELNRALKYKNDYKRSKTL